MPGVNCSSSKGYVHVKFAQLARVQPVLVFKYNLEFQFFRTLKDPMVFMKVTSKELAILYKVI